MKIYKYKFLTIKIIAIAYLGALMSVYSFGQPLCNSGTENCISVNLVQIGAGGITPILGYDDIGEVMLPCGYTDIVLMAEWEANPDTTLSPWSFISNNGMAIGNNFGCVIGCPPDAGLGIDTVTISVDIDSTTTCSCRVILSETPLPDANDFHLNLCEDDNDGIIEYDLNEIEKDSISTDEAVTISYHLNEISANTASNPITSSIGISDLYTLYARVANDADSTCFSVAEVSFSIEQNPIINLSADHTTLTCDIDSTTLRASVISNATVPYTYNWISSISENVINEEDTFVINSIGTQSLIVSAGACVSYTTIEIEGDYTAPLFDDIAISTPNGTVVDCQQSPLTLMAHATSPNGGALQYEWATNDGNIEGNSTQIEVIINEVGTYAVTVIQAETGCAISENIVITSASDSLELLVTPSIPTLTCYQPVITLTANSVSNMFDYIWSTGDTTATLEVDTSGAYVVVVTDKMSGCSADLEVFVMENFDAPIVDNDTLNICDTGTQTAIFDLTNATVNTQANTKITYHTNLSDAEIGTNIIVDSTAYSSGVGTVFARVLFENTGCFSIAEITLQLSTLEIPDVRFSPTFSELCSSNQVATVSIDNPIPNQIYTWTMNGNDPTNVKTVENCTALELPLGITFVYLEIQSGDCITVREYPVLRNIQATQNAEILRLGPSNILFCNRNDFMAYQWGFESKTNFCPQVIPDAIYQDVILENIDTDYYYYWLIAENEAGCTEKIYYLENPFYRLEQAPDIDYGELNMSVSPNPNNGVFGIELIGSEVQALDLHLYDPLGREFFYQHIDKLNAIERISLSFPDLPQGLYFIQITDNHGINLIEKVVIR